MEMGDIESLDLIKNNNTTIVREKISTSNRINPKKEELRKVKKIKKKLHAIDCLISVIIICFLVVSFWRCVWTLMDLYVDYLPKYATFFNAVLLHVFIMQYAEIIKRFIGFDKDKLKKNVKYSIIRRVYVYFYSVICILQWTVKDGLYGTIIVFGLSLFCLITMKSLRNCLAAPFVIILDNSTAPYDIPTRFRTNMAEKTTLYVLDCIFSVLVVGTLVVFVWRGAWVLLDDFLFPESASLSAWCSLVIGYLAVGLAFLLQPVMRWVCDRLQGGLRLIAADIFLLFSLFGTVNVWRGIWTLLNLYFLPDNQEISCWITHWICLILLVLLGCSNSLLVRGVYIDAEEPAGKCVIFPCYYLRLIFQQERAKKIAKRLQLDILAKRKQDIDNNIADINHMVHEKQPNNHVV
ncbi:uncharacterized protein [Onthophagus taurus]|uniref:uncharacterized protein isoform X2 n=1 Tax=Onthophagus taurus TaxID=166361 RepID=UPI0039BDF999